QIPVGINYYSRSRAIISYNLLKSARVHLQAAVAVSDPVTKQQIGPVMATIVNRAPRGPGEVAEFWNGFADGDCNIYVPELPNFKLAIAATELPENSIIALGNRQQDFVGSVASRNGSSLFTYTTTTHSHHEGLSALDDVAPQLRAKPENSEWVPNQHGW